ncbi:Dihydrolipoyl dehydrogenase [Pirellula sp. SH-Sr6A]|uniref:dihydrolipoyl dehydrogenase n=1 Tax=Pirellula sp. SH-Sr6A TaxID=1632865 RepID=UPI00078BE34B|nr:dihydrolipoyl dehydrogenase [Pirellula sp. SH-Sr6A]AMV32354.1 Dihydrolipoyl dehydrogenase [Pirellula sp. SH-Sr6A]
MKTIEHDVVVLGGGPGGYVAAIRAAQLGMNAACIDENNKFGGTCLRIGCIPSKALLESSHIYHDTKAGLGNHGVVVGQVQLDLAAMMKRKDQVVQTLTGGIDLLFKKNKVTGYNGLGQLHDPNTVVVRLLTGETVMIKAKHIILATGSRPASMRGVEEDGNLIGNSTAALSYPAVPENFVVIGGGYIGLELGSVWNRLGSKVIVLEAMDRILPGMDNELSQMAQRIFTRQGIEFRLNSWVESAKVENGKCVVRCKGAEPIVCDRVLLAAGRVPNSHNIGLETVGIETDKRGFVPVDLSTYRTAVPSIYAVGDLIGGAMLAHKAMEEAVVCVERIAGIHAHFNYDCIPAIVYTHPEIATVGKTEEQLKQAGVEYRKGVGPYGANGRARTLGDIEGRVKILADAKTDRVLGVHIIGARAGDLIAEASIAMEYGASSEDIARSCHAHPTLAEVVHEAALAVDGRAIHSA